MSNNLDGGRWRPAADQIAVQIRLDTLPGWFGKRLIVDPGMLAVIVADGRFQTDIRPGAYRLKSLLRRFADHPCTMLLARREPTWLAAEKTNLHTRDGWTIDRVDMEFQLRITDPTLFLLQEMGTRPTYSTHDLQAAVRPIAGQAVVDAFLQCGATDLTTERVEAALAEILQPALQMLGIRHTLAGLNVQSLQLERLRRQRGDLLRRRDELETGKQTDELRQAEQLRAIQLSEAAKDLGILSAQIHADALEEQLEVRRRELEAQRQRRKLEIEHRVESLRDRQQLERAEHESAEGRAERVAREILRRSLREQREGELRAARDRRHQQRLKELRRSFGENLGEEL